MEADSIKSENEILLYNLVKRLENAINNGHPSEGAGKLASLLASFKTPLKIKDLTGVESDIELHLTVEHSSTDPMTLILNAIPSASILSLKLQLWNLYKFMPNSQKWVFSDRLALDHEQLSEYLHKREKSLNVYVYIMTDAKCQNERRQF